LYKNKLHKLEKKDLNRGAEVLARAFFDYPMFDYILGDKLNKENIKEVLKYLAKYGYIYGEAYASSPEIEGIVLFCNYKDYNFNFCRSLRSGGLSLLKLGAEVGKKFGEYDEFNKKIHEKCIIEPHQYIFLLGVDPEKQGQGYGGKLLQYVLQVAEEKGQPCFLETHGEKNVAIYEKYGFKVVAEDVVPDINLVQYAMLTR
jgi:ribosomal protein S18 acetylase RimI-like enzyme